MQPVDTASGWWVSGWFAMAGLWVWLGVAIAHALWRSTARPEPNAVRPSGPIEPGER